MADLIVVLANGMVTEVGTHAQLVEADDHYADMYNKLANAYR